MGWGFLDDLDDSFHIVKNIKAAAGAVGRTAGDLAELSPVGWGAGAVVDIARLATPDREQQKWDKGFVRENLGLSKSLGAVKDLFADEHSATGGTISAVGKGFHEVSEHVWLGGIESAIIKYESGKTANPLGWGESYKASLQHSTGDTLRMALAVEQGEGTPTGIPDEDRAWYKAHDKSIPEPIDFQKKSSAETARKLLAAEDPISNKFASAMGFTWEIGDPTFWFAGGPLGKTKAGLNALRGQRGWDALSGHLDETGTLVKGAIDEWDAAEIYSALRFDKVPAGDELATALERSKAMEPQAALAVRQGVKRILNKDASGVAILAEHDPLAADQVKNAILGRATGSFDAGLADDAAREAGDPTRTFHTPEVVSAERKAAELDPLFGKYAALIVGGEPKQMMTTLSGARALRRLHRVGGDVERGILTNGTHRAPVEFFTKPLRTIGWASGASPAKAGAESLSNNLRDPHVYGLLDTNDPHLSIATARHIMRIGGVRQELAQQTISRVVTANGPEARASALEGAVNIAVHTMAKKFGHDKELVRRLLNTTNDDVRSMLTAVDGQIYSAAENPATGMRADLAFLPDHDGAVALPVAAKGTPTPLYATQGANRVVIPDLERLRHWLQTDEFLGVVSRKLARDREAGVAEAALENHYLQNFHTFLEKGNGWSKSFMLLPRAPAYMARNLTEEQMRLSTTHRFFSTLLRAGQHRKYLTASGRVRKGSRATAEALDSDEILRSLQAEHDSADFILGQGNTPAELADGTADDIFVDMANRRDELKGLIQARVDELGGEVLPSSKNVKLPGGLTAKGMFAGPEGRAYYDITGGKSGTLDLEGAKYGEPLFGRRIGGVDPRIPAPDASTPSDAAANYYAQWANNVNRHHRADALARIALKVKRDGGNSDDIYNAVTRFLSSPKSAEYRSHWPTRAWSQDQWAGSIVADIEHNIPTPELAGHLLENPTTSAELREMFPVGDELLPKFIHQAGTSATMGAHGLIRDRGLQWAYRVISRMSNDQLVRHPWLALTYEDEMVKATQALLAKGVNVTPEILPQMESAARRAALFKFKRTFYQNGERSSAAHHLRFLSPFFAAHQDSIRFWMHALAENPEWLRRATVSYNALTTGHVVTKMDGTPVDNAEFPSNDDVVTIGLGKWNHQIHPLSALIMLQQGTVTNPGWGPFAQWPMGTLQEKLGYRSDTVTAAGNYFNPVGPRGQATQFWKYFEPVVWTRIQDALDEEWKHDNPNVIKLWQTRADDLLVDYKRTHGGAEPPDAVKRRLIDQAASEAKQAAWMRAATSFASPLSVSPTSAYSGLTDQYYKLADYGRIHHPDDPFWASKKWLEKYGSAYTALTYSPSQMRTGLDSTRAVGGSMSAHQKLMDEVNPALWGLIVGPEGKADKGADNEFNANTYRHIRKKLESSKYYESESPMQRMYSEEVAAANAEYFRGYNMLVNDAEARGLRGPEDAKDLLAQKKWLQAMIGQKFPSWAEQNNPKKKSVEFAKIFPSVERIAADPKLNRDSARGDIKLLAQYVDARHEVQRRLDAAKRAGRSGDINAKSNIVLRWQYANYVMELKHANTDFEEFAMRYVVSKDPYFDEDLVAKANNAQ